MMSKSAGIAAVLLALAAGVWWVTAAKERTINYEMISVLAAGRDLPAGTALKDDLVEVVQVPRRYMQQDAFETRGISDVKAVNGLITLVMVPKGNQLTRSSLKEAAVKGAAASDVSPAQEHYLAGMKYFQNLNYEKAREEWKAAKKLDPSNAEVAAGLKRLDQITAAGK